MAELLVNSSAVAQQFNQAVALLQRHKLPEAERAFENVLGQQPDHFDALQLLGIIAAQTQRTARAAELFKRAIGLNPNVASVHSNLGNVLTELKCSVDALASYDTAIALKPDYAEAYNNRGTALLDLDRPAEALASYDKAIALKPSYAEAYNNRGTALLDLDRPAEALASYDSATALKPDYAEAHNGRGTVLVKLKRCLDALASYDHAIVLKPEDARLYCNRGNALHELKRHEEAVASYDKAIALQPHFTEAYVNRGNALRDVRLHYQALASYEKALSLEPDDDEVKGLRLHVKMHVCNWTNFDAEFGELISSVRKGNVALQPFALLALPSSPEDQLQCAQEHVAANVVSEKPVWRSERYNNERIRIAYLSPDFRYHPGAHLIAGLIEQHDRSRFEIIGVSFGMDDRSEIRKRLIAAFDQFYDVQTKSDQEVAEFLHDLKVDIAVDRNGHTLDSRIGIFARRPAPIQVAFLGYPGTTGTQFIDYIIADKVVAPLEHQQFFSEKIVHLPDCYQVNDNKRTIAESTPRRHALGLPEHGFVFCCFNNTHKIVPDMFGRWMRILKAVEGSILWLFAANAAAESNLRNEAAARGINPNRLVFAKRVPLADHLARHRLAGLFLDTLPYNAHTTASDALWAGLPVLTCLGEAFAGRVAASLLSAIRLPELITTTLEDYELLAIELANNPEKLTRIKQRLADNRLSTPLFDTKLFARNIEAAYNAMYKRHQAGLTPEYIAITDPR